LGSRRRQIDARRRGLFDLLKSLFRRLLSLGRPFCSLRLLATLLLLEEFFADLQKPPPAVDGELGVLEKGVDERRLAQQSDLIDDQSILRRARDAAREGLERLVGDVAVPDDLLENERVLTVASDPIELYARHLALLDEARQLLGRCRMKCRLGFAPERRVRTLQDSNQSSELSLPIEREKSARREELD